MGAPDDFFSDASDKKMMQPAVSVGAEDDVGRIELARRFQEYLRCRTEEHDSVDVDSGCRREALGKFAQPAVFIGQLSGPHLTCERADVLFVVAGKDRLAGRDVNEMQGSPGGPSESHTLAHDAVGLIGEIDCGHDIARQM